MKTLIILLILCVSAPIITAEQSKGDLWLLRSDHKIADALLDALAEKKLSPDAFSARISQLVKQRKIIELAKFNQNLGGGVSKTEKPNGELKVKDIDETIRMGIFLETEAHMMNNMQACDLRVAADIYEKQNSLRYYFKNVTTAVTIHNSDWQLLHCWKNETESTLLLIRIPSLPKGSKDAPAKGLIHTDVALFQTTHSNLSKFKKSTPKTRAKAIAWMRNQSKLLASTTIISRSGEKAAHQDNLCQIYNRTGWSTASLGFLFDIQTTLDQPQLQIDLEVKAEWQDPEKFAETPEFKFNFAKTIPTNQSVLVEPSAAPEKITAPIFLILTPKADHLKNNQVEDPIQNQKPIPDGISTRTYAVSPSFYRRLNDKHPDDFRQPLKNLLQLEGIKFPANTSAIYIASTNSAVIRHNKTGHLAFQKVLKKLSEQKQ